VFVLRVNLENNSSCQKINVIQNTTQGPDIGGGTLERVKFQNARYNQVQNLSYSRLLFKHTDVKYFFIWEDVLENGVLRIFGPKRGK
jgi:hypothetical protein